MLHSRLRELRPAGFRGERRFRGSAPVSLDGFYDRYQTKTRDMSILAVIFGILSGCFLAVLVGIIGSHRRIGFGWAFLISLIFTPLAGLETLEGLDGCEAFTLLELDADNTGATVE